MILILCKNSDFKDKGRSKKAMRYKKAFKNKLNFESVNLLLSRGGKWVETNLPNFTLSSEVLWASKGHFCIIIYKRNSPKKMP